MPYQWISEECTLVVERIAEVMRGFEWSIFHLHQPRRIYYHKGGRGTIKIGVDAHVTQ